MRTKYRCPECGQPVLKARWELGYEYCTSQKCVNKLGKVKVPMYEQPPTPDEMADLRPWELEDIAAMYNDDPED